MASEAEPIDLNELRQNAKKGAIKRNKKAASSNTTTYVALGIFGVVVAGVVGLLILHPEKPAHLIPAIDPEYISSQNSLKLGYTLKENNYFASWSLADVKQTVQTGLSQLARNMSPCQTYTNEGELVPTSYDIREEFPHCVQEVRAQGNCSSSYAFATSAVTSERFCIQSNGKLTPTLSPQDMISCSKRSTGCLAGNFDTAWSYIRDSGLVEETCFPYNSTNMNPDECSAKCDGDSYYIKDICATAGEGAYMREIKKNGPIVAMIQVYSDFLTYSGGVYEPHYTSTKIHGGQAVEVIGWGVTEKEVPYWIIKNSWGSDWGENGYAKVIRGNKDLGLEDFAVTAFASITIEEPDLEYAEQDEFEDLDKQEIPQYQEDIN